MISEELVVKILQVRIHCIIVFQQCLVFLIQIKSGARLHRDRIIVFIVFLGFLIVIAKELHSVALFELLQLER